MTNLRIWTTLTPAERSEAIEKAKAIIAGGEKRWHAVARLCGIKGGIPLRTALDEGWRARKREIDRKRSLDRCRAGLNRDPIPDAPEDTTTYVPAGITLPRVGFLEDA